VGLARATCMEPGQFAAQSGDMAGGEPSRQWRPAGEPMGIAPRRRNDAEKCEPNRASGAGIAKRLPDADRGVIAQEDQSWTIDSLTN
jgi:hypothetical protein